MRIAQVVDSYGNAGGLERFTYMFSRRLMEVGHETVVFAKSHEPAEWGDTSVSVTQLCDDASKAVKSILRSTPNFIVWHVGPSTSKTIQELSGIPIIATIHGAMCPSEARLFRDTDQVCSRRSGIGCIPRWYIRQCGTSKSLLRAIKSIRDHSSIMDALRKCNSIYAVSDAIRQFLLIEGLNADVVFTFDNTLGAVSQIPQIGELDNDTSGINILFVGRLVYAKGIQYLLRAVPYLLDWGYDVRCTIVGDGWYKPYLEDLAESIGVSSHVQFTGRVSGTDVKHYYSDANVVVVPSIWPEPAGLVVPEARSQGKPVVVFNSGGLPEWRRYMDGIYVAQHADVISLGESIVQAVNRAPCWSRDVEGHTLDRRDILQDIVTFG